MVGKALDDNPRMLARIAAFVVWALVAAAAVFWGLRLFVAAPAAPPYAVTVGESTAPRADLGRLLGVTPREVAAPAAAPELASRFKLLGVMAARPPASSGFATIAVDSRPARTYAVGSVLDGELVLQSVSLRSAAIGPKQGAPALTLEVPPLPSAATGSLPPVAMEMVRPNSAAVPPPALPPAQPLAMPPAQYAPGQVLPGQMPPLQQPPMGGRVPRTPNPMNR